uniref:Uncharacterized protein n=1 Tax=Aegilops tauschii TaxID=37682 RepID=R7WFB3_AEGTA
MGITYVVIKKVLKCTGVLSEYRKGFRDATGSYWACWANEGEHTSPHRLGRPSSWKARRRRLPEDGIKVSLPSPRFGDASSIIGGLVEEAGEQLEGADSSVRFLGAAMSSNPPSKHQVRLAGRGGIGYAPTSPAGARNGGLSLRATSPPPPTVSIRLRRWLGFYQAAARRRGGAEGVLGRRDRRRTQRFTRASGRLAELRLDGEEGLKEFLAVGTEEDAAVYASKWPAGGDEVTFDAPPTDEEVHAAVASIQQ